MEQPTPEFEEKSWEKPPMSAGRWTAALLLMLTFLLGISLGFIIRGPAMGLFRGSGPPPGVRGGPDGPGGIPSMLVDRMIEALDLTPDQQDEMDRILEENQFRMMDLRREMRPRTRAIADSTRLAIEAMLTPEQLERFKEMQRRLRRAQRDGRRLPRLE